MTIFPLIADDGSTDPTYMPTGVFKHREGNWGFRADDATVTGKRRQLKTVGFPSMAAAYSARIAYLAGKSSARPIRALLVSEWFELRLVVIRETRRPTTAANYKFAFERMAPYIGTMTLDELNEDIIRDMYRQMAKRYKTETISGTHGRLRAVLRDAVKENRMSRCPADNVSPPAGLPSRARRVWTFEQLIAFSKQVVCERDSAMWLTWMTTGLRRGEVCGLRWAKVSLDARELTVDWQRTLADNEIVEGPPKTRAGIRIVPLNDQVTAALREWRVQQAEKRLSRGTEWNGADYVFTTRHGTPYHPSSFDDRLTTLTKKADLPPLSPHELRHTFATRCLDAGMSVKLVSAMLGHSKVETTQNLYQHISPAMAHKEADAMAARMLG